MKRWIMTVGIVSALSAAVYTAAAAAAPIPGATFSRATHTYTDYLFIGTNVGGPGLTGLGCPFIPHDDAAIEAQTAQLTLRTQGWYGPAIDDTFTQQVLVRAKYTGTLEDEAGNTYNVRGHFLDDGILDIGGDLLFDGPGSVTFSGPTGTVVGTAVFHFLQGPYEMSFTFTSIKRCDLAP